MKKISFHQSIVMVASVEPNSYYCCWIESKDISTISLNAIPAEYLKAITAYNRCYSTKSYTI